MALDSWRQSCSAGSGGNQSKTSTGGSSAGEFFGSSMAARQRPETDDDSEAPAIIDIERAPTNASFIMTSRDMHLSKGGYHFLKRLVSQPAGKRGRIMIRRAKRRWRQERRRGDEEGSKCKMRMKNWKPRLRTKAEEKGSRKTAGMKARSGRHVKHERQVMHIDHFPSFAQ